MLASAGNPGSGCLVMSGQGRPCRLSTRGCPSSQCWSKPGAVSSVKGPSCSLVVGWGRWVSCSSTREPLSEGSSAGHPPPNHFGSGLSALKQRLLESALRQQEELITRSILPTQRLPLCLCRVGYELFTVGFPSIVVALHHAQQERGTQRCWAGRCCWELRCGTVEAASLVRGAASCAAHLLQSFVNGRAVLCRRRSADTTQRVLPWERWAVDAPSLTIHIIFCICSVFTPPCYNQPAVENNRTFKPAVLCGLSNVNGAERAAGLRLPRSRAWPWLSGQPWLLGSQKGTRCQFPLSTPLG